MNLGAGYPVRQGQEGGYKLRTGMVQRTAFVVRFVGGSRFWPGLDITATPSVGALQGCVKQGKPIAA